MDKNHATAYLAGEQGGGSGPPLSLSLTGQPDLMIAPCKGDGSVNVMNAAWGAMVERVMADGKVDISRVDAIAFDPYTHGYYRVGEAFKDGLKLKK